MPKSKTWLSLFLSLLVLTMTGSYYVINVVQASKTTSLAEPLSFNDVPWWNGDWKYRWPINITGRNWEGIHCVTDYQIAISLNPLNFDFSKANRDGSDLRFVYYNFTDGSQEELSYWIEEWNPNKLYAKIWIKAPYIPARETITIWMYYGNPNAKSMSSFDGVFQKFQADNTTVLLYHFDKPVENTVYDSSSYGNNGFAKNIMWTDYDGGLWNGRNITFSQGGSIFLNGENSSIIVPYSPSLNPSYVTVEAWVKPIHRTGIWNGILYGPGYRVNLTDLGRVVVHAIVNGVYDELWGPAIPSNEWSFLAYVFNGTHMKIYVNGELTAQKPHKAGLGVIDRLVGNVTIGFCRKGDERWFYGWIDEIRVLSRPLTDGEVKADYQRRKYVHPEPIVTVKQISEKWIQLIEPKGRVLSGKVDIAINITSAADFVSDVTLKILNGSNLVSWKYMYRDHDTIWKATMDTTKIPDGNYTLLIEVKFFSGDTVSFNLGEIIVKQSLLDRITTFLSENPVIVAIIVILVVIVPWTFTLKEKEKSS